MLSTLPAIATPQCRRYKRTTSEFLRKWRAGCFPFGSCDRVRMRSIQRITLE
jgi:hypothetical protein